MFSIAVLFAVGTSTIIAIYLGQGSRENANSLFPRIWRCWWSSAW